MTKEHAIKCLDGELHQLERVANRRDERMEEYIIAAEAAHIAFTRYQQAQQSFERMQERIAFIELTLAEHDA